MTIEDLSKRIDEQDVTILLATVAIAKLEEQLDEALVVCTLLTVHVVDLQAKASALVQSGQLAQR